MHFLKWFALPAFIFSMSVAAMPNSAAAPVDGTLTFQSPQLPLPSDLSLWGMYNLGPGSGGGDFYSADIDGDGVVELISASTGYTTDNRGFINIIKKVDGTYKITERFSPPALGFGVKSLAGFNSNLDSPNHLLFVAGAEKNIYFYNLSTKAYIASLETPAVEKLLVQDVDGDGTTELVAVLPNQTLVINIDLRTIKYTYPIGASEAVFGYFTGQSSLGLALNNGKVYSVNGPNVELIWENEVLSGRRLAINDADENNIDELIVANSTITSVDVNNKKTLWSSPTVISASALFVFDVDEDGVKDILYGDEQWGKIHALNPMSGNTLWTVTNPDWGVGYIAVANMDEDSSPELIWTAADSLNIYDLASRQEKARINVNSIGPFHAYAVADVDADGHKDIVAVSISDNKLYVINAATYELKWSRTLENFRAVQDLKVGDIDGDSHNEIVMAAGNNDGGVVAVLDGLTGDLRYLKNLDETSPITSIAIIDVDNDHINDIVAGNTVAGSGSVGQRFYVLSGSNGNLIKESPILSSSYGTVWKLDAFNLDDDQSIEIVGARSGKVFVYDFSSNTFTDAGVLNVAATTYAFINGRNQIINGFDDGSLSVMGSNFVATPLGAVCKTAITHLSQYSPGQILFICGADFGVFNISSKTVEWRYSAPINFSGWHGLHVEPLDGNRFLVGGDALEVFKIPALSVNGQSITSHFKETIHGVATASAVGEYLFFELTAAPSHGVVTVDKISGEYTYVPDGFYLGNDQFSIAASYLGLESNVAQIKINLINNYPTPVSQTYAMKWVDGKLTGLLKASDSDNDKFAFAIIDPPLRGSIVVDEVSGAFTYQPNGDASYQESFTYVAIDGLYNASQPKATVTINVTGTKSTAESGSGGGGGGSISFLSVFLLFMFSLGRRQLYK